MAITVLSKKDMIDIKNGTYGVIIDEENKDVEVFGLKEDGLSTKEIADRTGLSSQKVAAILRKGK